APPLHSYKPARARTADRGSLARRVAARAAPERSWLGSPLAGFSKPLTCFISPGAGWCELQETLPVLACFACSTEIVEHPRGVIVHVRVVGVIRQRSAKGCEG